MFKYKVCGITITGLSPSDAAEEIARLGHCRVPADVHLCNAYTLSLVDSDPRLREALSNACLNLPDGTPVAWLGRRIGVQAPVRGPSLVGEVARVGTRSQLKHYFYGGHSGVAEGMADQLRAHAPGLVVAGVETPPYGPIDSQELSALSARVLAADTDIVWVGLGTPQQDYFVPELARSTGRTVVAIGAAFDFWAGRVAQAPAWMHGSGLEWLYRLYREPRRLWRRYLLGNPRFVVNVLRHKARPRED